MYTGRLRPRGASAPAPLAAPPEPAVLRNVTNDGRPPSSFSGKKRDRPAAPRKESSASSSSGSSSFDEGRVSSDCADILQVVLEGAPEDVAWLVAAVATADYEAGSRPGGRIVRAAPDWPRARRQRVDAWCSRLGMRTIGATSRDGAAGVRGLHYRVGASSVDALRSALEAARRRASFCGDEGGDTDIESDPDTPPRPHSLPRTQSPQRSPDRPRRCDSLVDRMGQLNVLGVATTPGPPPLPPKTTPETAAPPPRTAYPHRAASFSDAPVLSDDRPFAASRSISLDSSSRVRASTSTADTALLGRTTSSSRGRPSTSTADTALLGRTTSSSRGRRSSRGGAAPFLPLFDDDASTTALSSRVAKRFSFGTVDARRESTASTATCVARPPKPSILPDDDDDDDDDDDANRRLSAMTTVATRVMTKTRRMSTSPPRSFAERFQTPQHPCVATPACAPHHASGWGAHPDYGDWGTSESATFAAIQALRNLLNLESSAYHDPFTSPPLDFSAATTPEHP